MGESYDAWRVNSDAQYMEEEDDRASRMVPQTVAG
jgi:hypothetical protein